MKKIFYILLIALILFKGGNAMAFEITSQAFTNKNAIPPKFTCDGANVSPPLSWKDTPAGTKSFAIIADDPDAPVGTWVHWIAWNIPASNRGLDENVAPRSKLADGTMQGINDFKKTGYGGPCPPSGTHRYFFKLYALDTFLALPESTTKPALEAAIKGHALGQVTLMGTYSHQR